MLWIWLEPAIALIDLLRWSIVYSIIWMFLWWCWLRAFLFHMFFYCWVNVVYSFEMKMITKKKKKKKKKKNATRKQLLPFWTDYFFINIHQIPFFFFFFFFFYGSTFPTGLVTSPVSTNHQFHLSWVVASAATRL